MKWFLSLVGLVIVGVWVYVAANRLSADAIAAITVSVVALVVLGVMAFLGALIWSSSNHQTHRERVASIKAQHQARLAPTQWQPPVIIIESSGRIRDDHYFTENPDGRHGTNTNRAFPDYAAHVARLTQDTGGT